ncbi:predicted protein [Chaetomium globosum CBS 148.51]|uniref:Uncharacterized protein n=1 Tax=Chaetomium globosum (strain ATCC 6205 / CBS 148.51 / DSM 1962 / NBRC 6347 / NRRL 1970) TaxID=306901 RepID=Q2H109_CHAGB|nr:uncharacterized protein CHGG_04537 [Chaetomium globosum CBS 148.51]EAQ87918.1 predicted protein [Chaetomium globosum CBS 148.51]
MEQILETLRLETLKDIPLTQLSEAIKRNLPDDVDKGQILDIYIMWLHPRLADIDVSAKGHLGLEVFYLYHFLQTLPGDHSRLADAFHDWQRSQAVGTSDISTRVRIAEAEFRRLMPASQNKLSESNTDSSVSENRFGNMHPDRARLSQNTDSSISEDRFGNMHPDRARLSQDTYSSIAEDRFGNMHLDRARRSQDTCMFIELDDDDDDGDAVLISSKSKRSGHDSVRGKGGGGQPELSFLTGSNKLPMNGKAEINHKENSEGSGASKFAPKSVSKKSVSKSASKAALKSQGKPVSKPKSKSGSKSATSATPPEGKAARGPSNVNLGSMTQQRLASVKHNGYPSDGRRGGPREYRPVEARDRSRSPLRKLDKHIGKDAQDPPKKNLSGSQTLARNKRKASPPSSPLASRKRSKRAIEISSSLSNLASSKVKEPLEEMRQPRDDEANERHDSRANDHQPAGPIQQTKRNRKKKKTKSSLKVLPSSKVKQPSEEVRLSYDDEVNERHESNSRANNHKLSELISRNRRTRAKKIRDSQMTLPPSKVKQPSEEVRLSYGDEADERRENNSCANDHQLPGLTSPKKATPVREVRGSRVVSPNLKVKELLRRPRALSDGEIDETFELAVLELIRVESLKTDLLPLDPPSNPFSAFSLEGQESLLRANKTSNEPRLRAADFYDMWDGEERPPESIDAETAADTDVAREPEQALVLAQDMVELTMALAELANPNVMEGEDAMVAEHEPEMTFVISPDAARLEMLAEGSFRSEISPTVEAILEDCEPGTIVEPTNNGVLSAENVAKAAVSNTMTEESNQAVPTGAFPDQFVAPEAIDAREAESLSPRPFDESLMEAEVTATAANKLSTTLGEPVELVAGPGADIEMAEGQGSFVTEDPVAARDCDI